MLRCKLFYNLLFTALLIFLQAVYAQDSTCIVFPRDVEAIRPVMTFQESNNRFIVHYGDEDFESYALELLDYLDEAYDSLFNSRGWRLPAFLVL